MNFHIYFLSTPIILKSIKETLDRKNSSYNNLSIQLVEFHLPLHELPPHYHTTKDLPPHLNSTLIQAFQMSSSKFPSIIETLKPNLIIYDGFQPWVATMASSCNIHAIMFYVSSTSNLAYFYHQFLYGSSSLTSLFPFSSIYLHDYEIKKLDIQPIKPRDEKAFGYMILKSFEQSHNIVLLNTCREIEGKYIDYVSTIGKKELIPIRPLIREVTIGEEEDRGTIQSWLAKKDQFSCVYVSFGSEIFLSKQEIEEIAKGLELSKVNFIWTIEFPKGVNTTIEEMVPQGFLESTKGKGWLLNDGHHKV
ncbi:hypothetical protein H5410_048529 [Solanum commersonii]|uniref:Uncharacterized protein n=1 Tax=Solanum commersonii TaxID=4109 RepID=A0A9J5XKQ5_SOLCO|nr:hypothetical protein H5410_048529 [Solanum commersonii]